jgi:hypothetical protein
MRFAKKSVISAVVGLALSGSVLAERNDPVHMGEGFTAGEHISLGDVIKVYLATDDKGATGDEGRLLHLENGMAVTYGDIVSLGDFYGVANQPIAFGKTKEEREATFMLAFNQFNAVDLGVKNELQQLLDITHEERKLVDEAILHGENIEAIYKKIGEDHNRRYNCVTGGGCGKEWWLFKGRYLQLAQTDYDHFNNNASIAYETGHDLAVAEAIKAHDANDVKLLEKAYVMNAFASHFLSDRFSAGHMRTPRLTLDLHVTPAVVGALLSHYMHDEESTHGLHVYNARGNKWVAYGDKHYLDSDNAEHRHLLYEAMQQSADEIFAAYQTGVKQVSSVMSIIPDVDTSGNVVSEDIAPMFYWDESAKKIYRRSNLSDPYDYHFTTNWWGWSTFVELGSIYGLPHSVKRMN